MHSLSSLTFQQYNMQNHRLPLFPSLATMCSKLRGRQLSDPVFVHSLYQDGSGRQCLLLERLLKSDAGWYTLSAINEAGMSTCNARLDVGSK